MRRKWVRFGSVIAWLAVSITVTSCLHGDDDIDVDARYQADIQEIDSYVQAKNISVYKDRSGIRFHIDQFGSGLPAKLGQTVNVKYQGRLLSDETLFDEGTIKLQVSQLIAGWQYAMLILPKGTKGSIYIPSGLGYGSNEIGKIPANSILMFDIDILDIIKGAAEIQQEKSDIVAIDKYLADKSINAHKDSTGVRYVITTVGTGLTPTWFEKVRVKYNGKVLSSGTEFFNGTSEPGETFDSRVADYIHGLKVSILSLKVGGKGTFYVPSGLGFGATENVSVPANSNLVFEVELLDIVN